MSNTTETLQGGRNITVTKLDGTTEEILVKKVPFFGINNLAAATGDDFQLAGIYTGKDEKWLMTLSDESCLEILEVGGELNDKSVLRLIERSSKKLESPVVKALAKAAVTASGSSASSAADLVRTKSGKPAPISSI